MERKGNAESKQDRQYTYNVTMRRFHSTIVAEQNNKYYILWVCVCVALVIQHAQRMRHIVMCRLYGSTYFSTLSHKRKIPDKKKWNIKFVFWFPLQILSEKFPIIRRIERDKVIDVYWSSCEISVILFKF